MVYVKAHVVFAWEYAYDQSIYDAHTICLVRRAKLQGSETFYLQLIRVIYSKCYMLYETYVHFKEWNIAYELKFNTLR